MNELIKFGNPPPLDLKFKHSNTQWLLKASTKCCIIYFMGKLGLGEEFLKNHKTQISEK